MARLRRAAACAAGIALLAAVPAGASVTTLVNDSTSGGVPSSPGNFFIPGEEAAAWLTSTCNGHLIAAQVYWTSQFGGAPSSLETAIRVYAAGTFPAPGAVLPNLVGGGPAAISGPTLVDGVMNDFRFLDPPSNTVPLRVAVTTGQTVVVSLEHLNQNQGLPFSAGVGYDADGCQASRNAVMALPGGWLDACSQGVPGDWVIRAVVDCAGLGVPSASPPALALLAALLLAVGAIAAADRTLARR